MECVTALTPQGMKIVKRSAMSENMVNLFQWVIFLGAAFVSILTSLLVITRKNPIHSALCMVMTFICVAVLYLLLQNQFIAIIQVIVYAGAIIMLIIFVLMLLDLEEELCSGLRLLYSKVIGGILAVVFLLGILYAVIASPLTGKAGLSHTVQLTDNVRAVGRVLFTQYFFPFEIASILLVAAVVGAVVLSKKTT
jgi:NADH-quinone oxidoreductase subunit J